MKLRKAYGMILAAAVLCGCVALPAQEAKKKISPADQMAELTKLMKEVGDGVNVPEVPEAQRATRAQIDELFVAMKYDQQLAQNLSLMTKSMRLAMKQAAEKQQSEDSAAAAKAKDREAMFEAMMDQYLKKVAEVIESDDVLGPMKDSYQRYLTADDVKGLIAFYSSEPGQHLLDRQSKIQLDAAPKMMQALQGKVMSLVQEMAKQIEAAQPAPEKKTGVFKQMVPNNQK